MHFLTIVLQCFLVVTILFSFFVKKPRSLAIFFKSILPTLIGLIICELLFPKLFNITAIYGIILAFVVFHLENKIAFEKSFVKNLTVNPNLCIFVFKDEALLFNNRIHPLLFTSIPKDYKDFISQLSEIGLFIENNKNLRVFNKKFSHNFLNWLLVSFWQEDRLFFCVIDVIKQEDFGRYQKLINTIINEFDDMILISDKNNSLLFYNRKALQKLYMPLEIGMNVGEIELIKNSEKYMTNLVHKTFKNFHLYISRNITSMEIMDSAPFGFCLIDSQLNILYCNHSIDKILKEKNVLNLVALEHQNKFQIFLRSAKDGMVFHPFTIENDTSPTDVYAVKTVDNKIAIYFIKDKYLNEISAVFLHQQRLQSLGEMVGTVVHDFNNVVATIISVLDMYMDRNNFNHLSEDYVDLMRIKHSAVKAADLIKQMLNLSKRHTFSNEVIDINTVTNAFSNTVRKILDKKIKFTLEMYSQPLNVMIKEVFWEQILMNIIVNARDSMPNGGELAITISVINIKESFVENENFISSGDYVEIAISDTGTGIAPHNLQKIFEIFFSTKEDKGTGFGLATVKLLIQKHGGFIKVKSQENMGTTFFLYLPIYKLGQKKKSHLRKPSILVVEDEPIIRNSIVTYLRTSGFEVFECDKHKDAIQISNNAVIDVLVCDLSIDEGGKSLAIQMKKINPSLRVIFISGYIDEEATEETDAIFLEKPFSKSELIDQIRSLL